MSFLYSQLFVTPTLTTSPQTGKTVLITGSNVGLGKEAARHFARLGASTIILAVRSIEKGEAAKADIEKTTKISKDVIKVWKVDMSSYQSVLDFGTKVEKELPRLDAAILNAGVARGMFELAEESESTITVNVISTFLLAHLLLPKMKATATKFNVRPNLTIVASEVHAWTPFKERTASNIFDRMNETQDFDPADRYQLSKLLDVLGTRAMTDRKSAAQIPVTINYVNPGLCQSELSRESGLFLQVLKFFLARTTEKGSRTLVHAAVQGPETHGHYMSDTRIEHPSSFVLSQEGYETQNRMWGELTAKLEKIKPGVTKNL